MSTTRSTTIRMMPGGASFCRRRLAEERREAEDWLKPTRVITYKSFIDSVERSTKELTIGERTRLNDNNNNNEKQPNYWTFKRNFVSGSSSKTKRTTNKSDATSLLLNDDDDDDGDIFQDVSGDAKLRFDDDDDDERMKFLRFKEFWRLVKSVTVATAVVIFQLYHNWVGSSNKQQRTQEDLR